MRYSFPSTSYFEELSSEKVQSNNAEESDALKRHIMKAQDDAVSDVIISLNGVAKNIESFTKTSERNAVTAEAVMIKSKEASALALNNYATASANIAKEHSTVAEQLHTVEVSLMESAKRLTSSEELEEESLQKEKEENEKGTNLIHEVKEKIIGLESASLVIKEREMIAEISDILQNEREKVSREINDFEIKNLKNDINNLSEASNRIDDLNILSSAMVEEQIKDDKTILDIQEKAVNYENQSIENKILIEEKEKEIFALKNSMFVFVNKIMDIEKTFGSEIEKINSDKSLKKLEKKLLDLQDFEIKLAFENKKINFDVEESEKLKNEILEDELNGLKDMEGKFLKLNEVISKKNEKNIYDIENLNASFSALEKKNSDDLKELKLLQSGGDNDLMDNLEKLQDKQHSLTDSTKNFFVRSETEFRQKNLLINEKSDLLNNEFIIMKSNFDDSLDNYDIQNKISSHIDVSSIENIKMKIDTNILNLDNSIHAKVMKVTEDEIFTMNQNLITSSNQEKEKTRVSAKFYFNLLIFLFFSCFFYNSIKYYSIFNFTVFFFLLYLVMYYCMQFNLFMIVNITIN